jgi:hypothetical protein
MTLGTITVGVGQTTDQTPPPPPPPPPSSDLTSFLNQIMPFLLILMIAPLLMKDFPKAKSKQ